MRVCQRVRWHLCTALWCVASESSDHHFHTFIVPPFHPPCPPPQSSLVRTYTPIVTQYPPSDAAGTTQWQQTRWAHVAEYMLLNKHNAMATASSIHMVRHARCCSPLSSSLSRIHTHTHTDDALQERQGASRTAPKPCLAYAVNLWQQGGEEGERNSTAPPAPPSTLLVPSNTRCTESTWRSGWWRRCSRGAA